MRETVNGAKGMSQSVIISSYPAVSANVRFSFAPGERMPTIEQCQPTYTNGPKL
jgi:hypothetical protein